MINQKKIRIILAVLLLLIFLHLIKIDKPLGDYFIKALNPVENSLLTSGNSLKTFFYYLLKSGDLLKENFDLKNKLNELNLDKAELSQLKDENENLKKSFKYFEQNNYNYLMARIIGRTSLNPQLFVLDKGKNDGVKENLAVVYNDGIMIGKITKVEDNVSYLLILTDSQSLIAARTLNNDKTIGLVVGQLGLNAKLTMIPQTEEINKNDLVVTSGLEENIPSGLLIGEVSEIKQQPEALFKEAILQPAFNIKDLNLIFVILPKYE